MTNSVSWTDFGKQQLWPNPFASMLPFTTALASGNRSKAEEQLPDDLADYLVYVTRNALLAGTSTLSSVWTEIYKFFVQVSWLLAFERMTREMLAWQAANPIMALLSGGQAQAASQPWLPSYQQAMPLLPFWGPKPLLALPKPETPRLAVPADMLQALPSMLAAGAAMLAIPATLLATMPMLTHMWPTTV